MKSYSDAALLELIAPINPIPLLVKSEVQVNIRIRPDYKIKRCEDGSRRVDSFSLGEEFCALPLHLPNVYRAPTHIDGLQPVGPSTPAVARAAGLLLDVEQVLQMWGYDVASQEGADHNWVRVVHRRGQHYLVNVYSEQHLAGGPVVDSAGRVVAVVSKFTYRNNAHLAFYVASLNDLEWC